MDPRKEKMVRERQNVRILHQIDLIVNAIYERLGEKINCMCIHK